MRNGTRAGQPANDDFQDDQTGDTGDDAGAIAAAEAAAGVSGGSGAGVKPGANTLGAQRDKLKSHAEAWEEQQREIDAIMDEAKERCQPYKDEQKAIAKAAAEGSADEPAIPKQIFKASLTIRRFEAKKGRTVRKLNEDQRDELMALAETEGAQGLIPLPLYEWAIEGAAKKKPAARRSRR